MQCLNCGQWNRCPACQGWVCEACGAELAATVPDLVAICQEIANDPQVDLVFSEKEAAALPRAA